MIPKDHPRYESLLLREKIINAYKKGILAEAGMIAHGRGEAFDYLIGEQTTNMAMNAVRAAAAALILAHNPVISINGNTAALVPEDIVRLAQILKAKLEINLFYRTPERVKKIEKILKDVGAKEVLGTDLKALKVVEGLEGPRSKVSSMGIYDADVVLVPLEDGDRTEALVALGKMVITIDLNPISRTSKNASITIVDNIVRAIPNIISVIKHLKAYNVQELKKIVDDFDNSKNLQKSLKNMVQTYIKGDVKL